MLKLSNKPFNCRIDGAIDGESTTRTVIEGDLVPPVLSFNQSDPSASSATLTVAAVDTEPDGDHDGDDLEDKPEFSLRNLDADDWADIINNMGKTTDSDSDEESVVDFE
jgi:hypothetical protein